MKLFQDITTSIETYNRIIFSFHGQTKLRNSQKANLRRQVSKLKHTTSIHSKSEERASILSQNCPTHSTAVPIGILKEVSLHPS